MSDLVLLAIYIVIGIITGILSLLFGIGGGIVFVPSLLFLLPISMPNYGVIPFVAISTSLFAGSFSSTTAFFNHLRIKNIDFKSSILLASGSVLTAFIVPRIFVSFSSDLVLQILALLLFAIAIKMLLEKDYEPGGYNFPTILLFIFGLVVGTLSAIGGLGGGIFFVPILHYLFGYDIKKSVGTATLAVALTMISSALSYGLVKCPVVFDYQLGYINLFAGFGLAVGSVIGSFLGVRLLKKFKSQKMKKYFAVLVILTVLKIIF